MKKIIFGALVSVLLSGTATAQQTQKQMPPGKHNSETGEFRKSKMMDELNLTQTQKKQMKELKARQINKVLKIKKDHALTKAQKKQAIVELKRKMMDERKAILTPGQQAQLAEKRKLYKERRGENAWKESWQQLTPAQQAQVKHLNEIYHNKAEEIKDNAFLSKDARQLQLKELQMQKRKAMDNILTPEQKRNMKNGERIKQIKPSGRRRKKAPGLYSWPSIKRPFEKLSSHKYSA